MDQTQQNTSFIVSSVKNRKKDKDSQSLNKPKRCALMSFRDLPEYMKDNEFILNYYRADWPLKEAFFSLLRWHNETLNVWTYVLPFLFSIKIIFGHRFRVVFDEVTSFNFSFNFFPIYFLNLLSWFGDWGLWVWYVLQALTWICSVSGFDYGEFFGSTTCCGST